MNFVEILYLLATAALVVTGLTMVGLALQSYLDTSRRAMIHLSIGFTLVVGAAVATSVSAFLTSFEGVRSLLLVNTGFTASGFTFVVYSLVSYE
ncbi:MULTISPECIES: DUF7521 family protein [unclassified Haloparvum]|uniref:DUF7521 family protein n=1 Tax=Haloparvum sp. PAK95 TaxID=3418962 RepID=UPI003D2F40DF